RPDLGRGLGAGTGARRLAARVRAVRHFQAAADLGEHVLADEQVVNGTTVPQLDVRGLAAHEQPGPGHDVRRGDATRLRLLDALVTCVQGVDDAHVSVHGVGAVAAVPAADVGVGVHQPGHDDLAGHVVDLGVVRDGDPVCRADGHDPTTLYDEHAVLDRRGGDRED